MCSVHETILIYANCWSKYPQNAIYSFIFFRIKHHNVMAMFQSPFRKHLRVAMQVNKAEQKFPST